MGPGLVPVPRKFNTKDHLIELLVIQTNVESPGVDAGFLVCANIQSAADAENEGSVRRIDSETFEIRIGLRCGQAWVAVDRDIGDGHIRAWAG